MRWLTVMVGALATFIATSQASSATFVTNLTATPTYGIDGNFRPLAMGTATFPDVILHQGDELKLNVDFSAPLKLADVRYWLFDNLNLDRGASFDFGRVVLSYAYPSGPYFANGETGFSVDAVAQHVYGPPDPSTTFDLNSVSYLVEATPEPYTWALLLVGLGGIGVMMRAARRSRRQLSAN